MDIIIEFLHNYWNYIFIALLLIGISHYVGWLKYFIVISFVVALAFPLSNYTAQNEPLQLDGITNDFYDIYGNYIS